MHLWDMLKNETYNNSPRNKDDMKANPQNILFSVYNVFMRYGAYLRTEEKISSNLAGTHLILISVH
jgi:hypothetical protein